MQFHFVTENGTVACGKNDHDLIGNQEVSRVTCKACKYTNIFRTALATQRKISEKVINVGLFPKALWKNYIQGLPGRNALPRGF